MKQSSQALVKVKVIGRRDKDDARKGGDSEKLKGAPLKSSEFLFLET